MTLDVVEEQEKMKWAELVIFQFPLWWFSMPAIMKGWVERVFSAGLGYALPDRYGAGGFEGKKAMLIVTAGGGESNYSARGINGPIDDVLHLINHNMLFYSGMTVLPSFVTYKTDYATEEVFQNYAAKLRNTLKNIETIEPIKYRKQSGGDYVIPGGILKEGLERPGETGFDMHIQKD